MYITVAFHSTKTFEKAVNGTEISRKSFQKLRKLLNFRNANHSVENSRNSESKVEWKENFREWIFENLDIPREVVLCFGNFWKCCSICYWKLPKIHAGRFGRMESAHCFQYLILINQLLVQIVFTWRHGGHIGVWKQWNGGHVGVPNQSFGSWTLFLCKRFLLFQ